jgi:glycosyltransferase involved in cell wall biosynthesis
MYAGERFDTVHVFRFEAILFAQPYFDEGPLRARRHLDMDDIESKTARRLANLCRMNGQLSRADQALAKATQMELIETAAFHKFDRIYVCSEVDRQSLLDRRCKAEIRILRNAVRPAPEPVKLFRFLFVGSLHYYPNADAIRFFCRQILPIIRERAANPFCIDVVGAGEAKHLADLAGSDVNLMGQVPAVSPFYHGADAAIVPLRAGGGTRIKILEAFSYRRPVVSTSLGAEGLETIHNEHILIADTPEEFAVCCLRLMSDPELARRLVRNSMALLERLYTPEALAASLA